MTENRGGFIEGAIETGEAAARTSDKVSPGEHPPNDKGHHTAVELWIDPRILKV